MHNALRNEKTCGLTVGRYAASLIDFNEYLLYFHGVAFSDKIDVAELIIFINKQYDLDLVYASLCARL